MIKQGIVLLFVVFSFSFVATSQNNYNEISLLELMKKKAMNKNIVIVDVRTDGEYYDSASSNKQQNIGRIKETLHVSLQEFRKNPKAVEQFNEYKDKDIYFICSHSYRSRSVSNIFLKSGFNKVNNVRGGMTEWFRRYDDLLPYRNEFYEPNNAYKNLSSSEVAHLLMHGKDPVIIGIVNTPHFWWDSAAKKMNGYLPHFKNIVYYNYGDSLKVLEAAQKAKDKPIILFNVVNNGAAELTEWLVKKGISSAGYMVGGNNYFDEYILDKQLTDKIRKFIVQDNSIQFITPIVYCNKFAAKENVTVVDLRHDTLFNKMSNGVKYDYRYLEGSINFFSGNGEDMFQKEFPDKRKEYVFISDDGIAGLELADALTKKGYKINWIIGGLQRLEWYTINIEDFGCKNVLVK